MQRVLHRLAAWIIVAVRRHLHRAHRMVEPAGGDEPGEGAREGEAALALVFVQARMPEARRRMPADGMVAVVALRDVEPAIDHHREAQTAAGAELEDAVSPLDSVAQGHKPDARDLRQHPHALRHAPSAQRLPGYLHHDRSLSLTPPVSASRPSRPIYRPPPGEHSGDRVRSALGCGVAPAGTAADPDRPLPPPGPARGRKTRRTDAWDSRETSTTRR